MKYTEYYIDYLDFLRNLQQSLVIDIQLIHPQHFYLELELILHQRGREHQLGLTQGFRDDQRAGHIEEPL